MASPLILLGLGIIGLAIAIYLYFTITTKKEAVCLITEGTCNEVINSKYSKTFGIDNTLGGIGYYGLVIAASIAEIANPTITASILFQWTKIIVSGAAVAFSAYLVWVMGKRLKMWCEWCIASSIISLLIFIFVIL